MALLTVFLVVCLSQATLSNRIMRDRGVDAEVRPIVRSNSEDCVHGDMLPFSCAPGLAYDRTKKACDAEANVASCRNSSTKGLRDSLVTRKQTCFGEFLIVSGQDVQDWLQGEVKAWQQDVASLELMHQINTDEAVAAAALLKKDSSCRGDYWAAASEEDDGTVKIQVIARVVSEKVGEDSRLGFGELDKTLQQALKNNLARIKLNVFQPHCTEDTVVDVFGAMRECFVDLSKIISKVVNAKVWSFNTTDSLGKGDTFLRIAEMEKNMRDFIEEQVTTATLDVVSLIAESENRLRSFVKESVDDAVSTQLAKNNLGSMTSRSGVPKYTSDFHADAKRNWFSRGNEQSYKDAFEAMGGSQAVNKCRHITENVIVNDPLLESQVWQLLPKNCQSNDSRSKLVHQHFTLSLDTLFAEAQVVSQSFMSRVSELAKKTGGEACLLQPTPCECAKLKIKWEHGRDAWHRMTDITAARVVYPSIERMYQGLEATRDIFKGRIHELVDGYVKPSSSGFRELSLVVEHANHMCRLRLNTSSMTKAEETLRARVLEIQNDLERAIDDGSLQDCFSLLRWSTQLGIELGALPTFRGLHHAAGRGHGAICCALLEHQANVNAIDADGNSPLHLAAKGGHERAVWALLDRGKADSLLSNSRNETPLLIATLLLHRQPENKGAMDTVLVLAQAAGADHVRQVVLRLEELLSDNANIPLETF